MGLRTPRSPNVSVTVAVGYGVGVPLMYVKLMWLVCVYMEAGMSRKASSGAVVIA